MNEKEFLSNWLLEDLNLSDILFNQDFQPIVINLNELKEDNENTLNNKPILRAGYADEDQNDYTDYGNSSYSVYNNYSNNYSNAYSNSYSNSYSDFYSNFYYDNQYVEAYSKYSIYNNNPGSDYGEHLESGMYTDYNEYLDYDNYSNYDNNYYTDGYSALYSNYNNYYNTCSINCQFQCQINQFVNHYIEEFGYEDDLNYILTSHYNNLVSYINEAATYVNNLVTTYNLDNTLYKININLSPVTISDIYQASNFNAINDAINKFIDGITNILAKNKKEDFIKKEDMETLEEILNQIKIPPTTPKFT